MQFFIIFYFVHFTFECLPLLTDINSRENLKKNMNAAERAASSSVDSKKKKCHIQISSCAYTSFYW